MQTNKELIKIIKNSKTCYAPVLLPNDVANIEVSKKDIIRYLNGEPNKNGLAPWYVIMNDKGNIYLANH